MLRQGYFNKGNYVIINILYYYSFQVLKQLISECQGRGISPSNIKHLRYLKRFLQKTADYSTGHHIKPMNSLPVDPIRHETSQQQHRESLLPCASTSSTSATFEGNSRSLRFDRSPFMSSSHDECKYILVVFMSNHLLFLNLFANFAIFLKKITL